MMELRWSSGLKDIYESLTYPCWFKNTDSSAKIFANVLFVTETFE